MVHIDRFDIAALPEISFGSGRMGELAGVIQKFGHRMLLVTGAASFQSSAHWGPLMNSLAARGVVWNHVTIDGEPSPTVIDEVVSRFYGQEVEVVVGIGGGSAMDGAKAIAGLLPFGNSVMDHLEFRRTRLKPSPRCEMRTTISGPPTQSTARKSSGNFASWQRRI